MPLTLPKQQITGNLGINNISGAVTLPMQSVTGVAVMPFLSGTVGIPAPQVSGEMTMPGVFADVGIPMQLVSAEMVMPGLFMEMNVPMQQVAGDVSSWGIEFALTIPMQRISGLEPEIAGVVSIPMQEVTALVEQPILAIPMQQITASATVPLVIEGLVNIPMQQLPVYQTGDMDGTAPMMTGSAAILSGYWIDGTAPMMTGSATALIGSIASMSGIGPMAQSSIAIDQPFSIDGTAPLMLSGVDVLTGAVASIDASPILAQSALDVVAGTGIFIDAEAPLFESSIQADSFGTATMSGSPEMAQSSVWAVTGVAVELDAVMPAGSTSDASIWVRPEISMDGAAPIFTSQFMAQVLAQTVKLLALNIKAGGVTELQSAISIESVTAIGGVVYVAGPDGLFSMTGATDHGTAFNQSAKTGALDYGANQQKRPESVLIEAEATTAPILTVHAQAGSYAYESIGPKRGSLYRAKVGRGITGKRLQFEVSGTGIQSMESVDVLVEPGKRAF